MSNSSKRSGSAEPIAPSRPDLNGVSARPKKRLAIWFRVDAHIHQDPRFAPPCPHGAIVLNLMAIAWSKSRDSDGVLSREEVGQLARSFNVDAAATVPILLKRQVWRRFGHGYLIVDFADWQDSASDRARISEMKRGAARARWQKQHAPSSS